MVKKRTNREEKQNINDDNNNINKTDIHTKIKRNNGEQKNLMSKLVRLRNTKEYKELKRKFDQILDKTIEHLKYEIYKNTNKKDDN